MMYIAARYSFPTLGEFRSYKEPERELEKTVELDREREKAAKRGYAEGFANGREAAQSETAAAREAARQEGFEAGAADGKERAGQAAAAIEQALEEMRRERDKFTAEAESFCVDLALAIVARLVEFDNVRAEFVARAASNAIKALAPEAPGAIYLNPADRALLEPKLAGLPIKDDPALAPGHVRVEAARLVVQSGIDDAFAQIKAAVLETRARRKTTKKR